MIPQFTVPTLHTVPKGRMMGAAIPPLSGWAFDSQNWAITNLKREVRVNWMRSIPGMKNLAIQFATWWQHCHGPVPTELTKRLSSHLPDLMYSNSVVQAEIHHQ